MSEETTIRLKNLKRSRTSHELTRKALAVKAKTSPYTIDRAEDGQPIKRTIAEGIAAALGVKLTSLAS